MQKVTATILIAAAAVLSACSPRSGAGAQVREFPAVQVPSVASDPAEYAVLHYWDAFADTSSKWRCDTSFYAGVSAQDVSQQFANWTYALGAVPRQTACKAIAKAYDRLSASRGHTNAMDGFLKYAGLYLYDPNSPARDEDFYGIVASKAAADPYIPDSLRSGYASDAHLCSLNAVGTPAADFVFEDSRGRRHTLYSVNAEYIALLFSNPGCHACKDIMDAFSACEKFGTMIASGRLAVVNVYPDEDLDAWRGYLPTYPKSWHSGFDPSLAIREGDLYSLRAIPSLYLLDADKRVILKDCPTEKLLDYIERRI